MEVNEASEAIEQLLTAARLEDDRSEDTSDSESEKESALSHSSIASSEISNLSPEQSAERQRLRRKAQKQRRLQREAAAAQEAELEARGHKLISLLANRRPIEVAVAAATKLVNAGVDVTCSDQYGMTALHWACTWGLKDIVEKLISERAFVNDPAEEMCGFTPVHCAVQGGHIDVLHMLLAAGGDIHAEDASGHPTIKIARHEVELAERALMNLETEEEKAAPLVALERATAMFAEVRKLYR